MIEGLIGKKLGMTQVFTDDGKAVPVTVILAGPCVVVQKKTPLEGAEGYAAVQLGLVQPKAKVNQPLAGHFKRAGIPPTPILREFSFSEDAEETVKVGDQVLVQDVFGVNDLVDVAGTTKGRGFQGVVKRHGFKGGRSTHGSMFHRAPGSIGASAFPSRVYPGMKAAGRMGNSRRKVRGLRVVDIDAENHLLLVKGSVPGARGGYLYITHAHA